MQLSPGSLDDASSPRERRATSDSEADMGVTRLGRINVIPVPGAKAGANRLSEIAYRPFEIVAALAGLIVGLPFMVAVAVLVRLNSPGPVFFLHKRPARSARQRGRDLAGRSDLIPPPGGYDPEAWYYVPSYFTLIKFRTMYHDARARFPSYYAYKFTKENFHAQFPTIQDDPRVTRVGGTLRKLSLDEIPNLWSVVVGDIESGRPATRSSRSVAILYTGRNDQVHLQAWYHWPCSNQWSRIT